MTRLTRKLVTTLVVLGCSAVAFSSLARADDNVCWCWHDIYVGPGIHHVCSLQEKPRPTSPQACASVCATNNLFWGWGTMSDYYGACSDPGPASKPVTASRKSSANDQKVNNSASHTSQPKAQNQEAPAPPGALTALTKIPVGDGKLYGCDADANGPPCYTNNTWSPSDASSYICTYDAEESAGHARCTSQITPDRKGIRVFCGATDYSCGLFASCGASAKFILHSVTVGKSTEITSSCAPINTDVAKQRAGD